MSQLMSTGAERTPRDDVIINTRPFPEAPVSPSTDRSEPLPSPEVTVVPNEGSLKPRSPDLDFPSQFPVHPEPSNTPRVMVHWDLAYATPLRYQKGHFDYVPYDQSALRNLSSTISPANILAEKRRPPPSQPQILSIELGAPELDLVEEVPFYKAMSFSKEIKQWKSAMEAAFNSLVTCKTGILAPKPTDDKVIGGMCRLGKKLNEFGEVMK